MHCLPGQKSPLIVERWPLVSEGLTVKCVLTKKCSVAAVNFRAHVLWL